MIYDKELIRYDIESPDVLPNEAIFWKCSFCKKYNSAKFNKKCSFCDSGLITDKITEYCIVDGAKALTVDPKVVAFVYDIGTTEPVFKLSDFGAWTEDDPPTELP